MTKKELIDLLDGLEDSHEVRVSLLGDPYTLGILSVNKSKTVVLRDYIRITIVETYGD